MGYGEFGGGGSVGWRIDVDDETKRGKKRVSAFGRDAKQTPTFTVTLEFRSKLEAKKELIRLTCGGLSLEGNKIVFKVDVQKDNENQIRIDW